MSTLKQIDATKSTGPRTPEGKSAARLNAFKHGVFAEAHTVIGEDRRAFEALRDDFSDRFQPAGSDEEALVSNLINASWLLARFHRLETCAWDMRLKDPISEVLTKLQADRLRRDAVAKPACDPAGPAPESEAIR